MAGSAAGATALGADVSWEVDHPLLASLAADLIAPDDATRALAAAHRSGAGTASDRLDVGLDGSRGRWRCASPTPY